MNDISATLFYLSCFLLRTDTICYKRIFETAEGSVFLLVFVFADLFVEREDHRIDAQYDKHDDRVAKGPYQQR